MVALNRKVLLILLLPFFRTTNAKVFWKLVTSPVVLDKEVMLFCNTSASSCNNCTRAWFGKNREDVLVFQNITSNPEKYKTVVLYDGFSLIIKHFTEEDMNTRFKCVYGSDNYETLLTVGEHFEKIPKQSEIVRNKTLTDGRRLDITIYFLKVHPVPNCNVYYKNQDVSQNLNNTRYTKIGLYYNVLFEFSHDGKCHAETLNVNCSIGSFNMTVLETEVSFQCKAVKYRMQMSLKGSTCAIEESGVSEKYQQILSFIAIFVPAGVAFVGAFVLVRILNKDRIFTCKCKNILITKKSLQDLQLQESKEISENLLRAPSLR